MNLYRFSPLLLAASVGMLSLGLGPSIAQEISSGASKPSINYPETKQLDVVDNYHGREVKDPYQWLEDTESAETRHWVAAQNDITNRYLQSIPARPRMRQRLEKLWNYERYDLPIRRGSTYFYTHNDGLQNQSVLYKADSLDPSRAILLDPNTLSPDGTVALAGSIPSDDGKLLAYGLADGGSDWRTWQVRDVESNADLADRIRWVKFSEIAWKPDDSGFYYCRYDAPVEGQELTGTNENQRLYFHKLGDDQSTDELILQRPDQPKWGFASRRHRRRTLSDHPELERERTEGTNFCQGLTEPRCSGRAADHRL